MSIYSTENIRYKYEEKVYKTCIKTKKLIHHKVYTGICKQSQVNLNKKSHILNMFRDMEEKLHKLT